MDADKNTYHIESRHIHHTMAVWILGLLASGWFMTTWLPKAQKGLVYPYHKLAGLVALMLLLLRLGWRIQHSIPPLPNHLPKWQIVLAHATQGVLYLTMLIMPVSGWIMATASGHAPALGILTLNMPGIPLDRLLAETASSIHTISAWALLAAIGLHLIGALWHAHQNDGILRRMFPSKNQKA